MPVPRSSHSVIPLGAVVLVLGLGCDTQPEDETSAMRLYTDTDSMGVVPEPVQIIGVSPSKTLSENSGAVMSTRQPGIVFTINDSGNEPVLFALDTTGAPRGRWRIRDAQNHDWEAISVGPCAMATDLDAPDASQRCIYLGDVGDNDAQRKSLTIYRLREPDVQLTDSMLTVAAESLSFRYEGGRYDVEAMIVSPDGTVKLITKRPVRTWTYRLRPSLVFALPAAAWGRGAAIASRVDSLSIVPGSAPGRYITDASLSPDGRYLAVRTYWQIYVFATDSATGRVIASTRPSVCNIALLGERQGEGISWYLDTRRLLLTSEGRHEPMRVVECPLPRAPDRG